MVPAPHSAAQAPLSGLSAATPPPGGFVLGIPATTFFRAAVPLFGGLLSAGAFFLMASDRPKAGQLLLAAGTFTGAIFSFAQVLSAEGPVPVKPKEAPDA